MDEPNHIYLHPAYHQGQILALQKMVLALAQGLGVEQEWQQQSTTQIQQLRDQMLNSASSDIALLALDDSLAWLAKVATPPG